MGGVRQVNRKLVEVGRAYGPRGVGPVRGVPPPASLPSPVTGPRPGLAQGRIFLIAAEPIAASAGLGVLPIGSANTLRADVTLLATVLPAVVGKRSGGLLALLERRRRRWGDTFGGGA